MNSAYKKVVGCSKKKAEQRKQEVLEGFREEERLEREQAKAKIPSWIERGKELIYSKRYEDWENYVIRSVNSRFAGAEIEDALRIMTALEEGATMEEIKQSFKSDGGIAARGAIFSFLKRGPEFLEAVMYPTEEFRRPEIEAKRRENEELARINAEKNESTGKHI